MSATGEAGPAQSATADREIVISRIINAPRELVFEAFTDVRHLSQWWGPDGFTTTTRAFAFLTGGVWDFVMHGPDGTDYQEWIVWTEITPPARITLLAFPAAIPPMPTNGRCEGIAIRSARTPSRPSGLVVSVLVGVGQTGLAAR